MAHIVLAKPDVGGLHLVQVRGKGNQPTCNRMQLERARMTAWEEETAGA